MLRLNLETYLLQCSSHAWWFANSLLQTEREHFYSNFRCLSSCHKERAERVSNSVINNESAINILFSANSPIRHPTWCVQTLCTQSQLCQLFIMEPGFPWSHSWPFAQRINFNFPCSLTRNITSHSMNNLAFHILLRWKMNILLILNTSTCVFLSIWENVLFKLRSETVTISVSILYIFVK